MLRTVEHIRAELANEGLCGAPWFLLGDDEAEREAEHRYRLLGEIEEWCRAQTVERIKLEYNSVFAKVGLHLVRLPRWRA